MNVRDIIFVGIAFVTLLGAFLAVWLKNVFQNALALILALFGMAALFIYLNAEFLAVVQVIIYIGAISVAIIFAIMLSKPWFHSLPPRNPQKMFRAILAAALLFGGLWKLINATQWPLSDPASGDFSMQGMGKALLTTYSLPFEIVSLVLLVAIIGALIISAPDKKEAAKK